MTDDYFEKIVPIKQHHLLSLLVIAMRESIDTKGFRPIPDWLYKLLLEHRDHIDRGVANILAGELGRFLRNTKDVYDRDVFLKIVGILDSITGIPTEVQQP